jgi:hypothetical protein
MHKDKNNFNKIKIFFNFIKAQVHKMGILRLALDFKRLMCTFAA